MQFILLGVSKWVRALWGPGGLVFPLLSQPLVHVCSIPWLCYAVLIPSTQNKDICPRKVLLPLWPLLQPHPSVSHRYPCVGSMAVCPSVLEICSQPLSQLLQGVCTDEQQQSVHWVSGFFTWGFLALPALPGLPRLTRRSVLLWSSQ